MVKKKLLLIPVVLMSCFIAGCEYDTYLVPLHQWIEHNGKLFDDPRFYVQNKDEEKSGGYIDYEEYVNRVIKERTKDAEQVSKKILKNITTDTYVSYNLICHIEKMEYCSVHVYDNGYITTFAHAEVDFISAFFGRPKDQKVTYKIEEEKAKEIIELATNRYLEIKEEIAREDAELTEEAKIENVLNTFEQSEEPLKIWYNYKGNDVFYPWTFIDTNRELLIDFKTIEYEDTEDEFVYEKNRIEDVVYRIDDDLHISVYNHVLTEDETNYDLVSTSIRRKGKYMKNSYLTFYYKINSQKGKAIAQKAEQLFLACGNEN